MSQRPLGTSDKRKDLAAMFLYAACNLRLPRQESSMFELSKVLTFSSTHIAFSFRFDSAFELFECIDVTGEVIRTQ